MDMDSDLKLSITRLSVNRLDLAQQFILYTILLNVSEIENFCLNQVNKLCIY